jgi:hypothetical protein
MEVVALDVEKTAVVLFPLADRHSQNLVVLELFPWAELDSQQPAVLEQQRPRTKTTKESETETIFTSSCKRKKLIERPKMTKPIIFEFKKYIFLFLEKETFLFQ